MRRPGTLVAVLFMSALAASLSSVVVTPVLAGTTPLPSGTVADARVAIDARIALLTSVRDDGLDLEVEVAGGLVRLAGTVSTAEVRDAAVRAVRAVHGVKGVEDDLVVGPRPPVPGRSVHEVDDALLEARVKSALVRAFGPHSLRLQVEAARGDVNIAGTIPSKSERQEAVAAVLRVPGVVRVGDVMRVERSLRRELIE